MRCLRKRIRISRNHRPDVPAEIETHFSYRLNDTLSKKVDSFRPHLKDFMLDKFLEIKYLLTKFNYI